MRQSLQWTHTTVLITTRQSGMHIVTSQSSELHLRFTPFSRCKVQQAMSLQSRKNRCLLPHEPNSAWKSNKTIRFGTTIRVEIRRQKCFLFARTSRWEVFFSTDTYFFSTFLRTHCGCSSLTLPLIHPHQSTRMFIWTYYLCTFNTEGQWPAGGGTVQSRGVSVSGG